MRLDLSKEQINGIILSLKSHISDLKEDSDKKSSDSIVQDIINENITIETALCLYLEEKLKTIKTK